SREPAYGCHSGARRSREPGTQEHGLENRRTIIARRCPKPVFIGSGLAPSVRPGMTTMGAYEESVGYRSRQSGLASSITLHRHSGARRSREPGTQEHRSPPRFAPAHRAPAAKPVFMGSGLAPSVRPGMTIMGAYEERFGYRSCQSGLASSINRIFQSRRHFL